MAGVNDYSTDPSLNTSINGINIAEGCPPRNINNAIRQFMADIAAFIRGGVDVIFRDVQANRGDGTGVYYFGPVANNRYLYYDGTKYVLNGALLQVTTGIEVFGTATDDGKAIGTRELVRVTKSAGFTLDASMSGNHVYYTGGSATVIIPTNAATALPIGTAITLVNDAAGTLNINSLGGVSLIWNNINAARNLGPGGIATLLKVDTDRWYISGTQIS